MRVGTGDRLGVLVASEMNWMVNKSVESEEDSDRSEETAVF